MPAESPTPPPTHADAPTDEVPGGLKALKAHMRRDSQVRRAAAAAKASAAIAGEQLRDHILSEIDFQPGAPVSGFWPMGDEIDLVPTLEALHARGHPIGLPAMPGKAQPLVFRAWTPGAALQDGGFGTKVPSVEADEVTPLVLLVPLLAFDRAGYRLGYGGGFYDRTLAKLRAAEARTRAIGVAYLDQQIRTVPRDIYDQRLDAVVTEQGPVAFAAGAR